MGSLISAPIAAAGSCLGSCLGAAACTACCKACSCGCVTPPRISNVIYVTLMVLGAAAAMSLRVSGLTLSFGTNIGINGATTCFNASGECSFEDSGWGSTTISYTMCSGDKCKGNWAVYQISFAFMTFFSTMTFLTCTQSKFSSYAQHGYWFVKVLFILGMLVVTAFMDADDFARYSMAARYLAPLFMLYQLIMFIDFGYRINEMCLGFDEEERNFLCTNASGNLWKKWMLFVTVLIYIAIFVGIGVMYSVFPAKCSFNGAVITVTLLFVLINTGVGMTRAIAPHGSILTSAIVTGYCTFLCFGSLGSMIHDEGDSEECNPTANAQNGGQIVFSIILACGALFMTGWGAGAREQKDGGIGGKETPGPGGMTAGVQGAVSAAGVSAGGGAAGPDQVTVDVNADESELAPASFWRYHLVMTLCSIYMAMLLTNWGDSEDADVTRRYNLGRASAWVQAAANWTCSLLYLWTLMAPWCFKGKRDFGVEFEL